jgi:peptidyl-prolyl cis-trans isomerase A (cyclophilin A)
MLFYARPILLSLNKETNYMNLLTTTQKQLTKLTLVLLATLASFSTQATIVQLETSFGNFSVNLYDQQTPETVTNFLQYVDDGNGNNAYSNAIIHRSVDSFILQGGGFTYNGGTSLNTENLPLDNISANPAVINEPVFSSVRGTIAMAKLGGNPNSATNQWFFNLANNASNLDNQNGGFTVFGEVTADGLAILDQMAAVPKYDKSGAFTTIPLSNYDGTSVPDANNLMIISSIQIIDPAVDTAAGLNPTLTTATPPAQPDSSGGGAGTLGGLVLALLVMGTRKRIL